jgi:hypothetical protein
MEVDIQLEYRRSLEVNGHRKRHRKAKDEDVGHGY